MWVACLQGFKKGRGNSWNWGVQTRPPPPTPAQMQPRPVAAVLLVEFLPVSVFEF